VARVGTALEDIDAETSHLTALVEDLLLLARTDAGSLELERAPLDLADVAVEAVAPLNAIAAGRGILHRGRSPADRLSRETRSACASWSRSSSTYGIAHTPRGGSVTVRVRPEAGSAVMAVEDDGPGIREEDGGAASSSASGGRQTTRRAAERAWASRSPPGSSSATAAGIAASQPARGRRPIRGQGSRSRSGDQRGARLGVARGRPARRRAVGHHPSAWRSA